MYERMIYLFVLYSYIYIYILTNDGISRHIQKNESFSTEWSPEPPGIGGILVWALWALPIGPHINPHFGPYLPALFSLCGGLPYFPFVGSVGGNRIS